MEQIVEKAYAFREKMPVLLGRQSLIIVSLGITLSVFASSITGTRLLAQITATPASNPFDPFLEIVPTSPSGTLNLKPASGIFSRVDVTLHNGIREVVFTVRENSLRTGDLVALWGPPESKRYGPVYVYFRWSRRDIYVPVPRQSGNYSLYLPVRTIYFFNVGPDSAQFP